ncbi:MAG: hypothetical protein WAN59_12720 [Candidatus Baltobacteraceae bacterium]
MTSSRTPRRRTNRDDISTALDLARKFHTRANAVESEAADQAEREYAAGIAHGLSGSPSRVKNVEDDFVLEVFGFVAAIRTTWHYIYAAVAKTPGESPVRDTLLQTAILRFHKQLANQALHAAMIVAGSRIFYIGGPKHGRFTLGYAADELDDNARPLFDQIQAEHEKSTGARLSVLELGENALAELTALDAQCTQKGWY